MIGYNYFVLCEIIYFLVNKIFYYQPLNYIIRIRKIPAMVVSKYHFLMCFASLQKEINGKRKRRLFSFLLKLPDFHCQRRFK